MLSIRCCGIVSYFKDDPATFLAGNSLEESLAFSWQQVNDILIEYVRCNKPAQECVSELVEVFPETLRTAHEMMPLVCSMPSLRQDLERRAALQLAILNRMPKTYTPCCGNRVCFRCKTYGWHEETCEEIQRREMGQKVCFCPHCGVPTIKSEGCDHMVCVCGADWTWNLNPLLQLLRSGCKARIEPALRELEDINAVLEGSHLPPVDYFIEYMRPSEDALPILKLFAKLGAVASPAVHKQKLWSVICDLNLTTILLQAFQKVSPSVITELLEHLVEVLCVRNADRMSSWQTEERATMVKISMLLIEFGANLHEASLCYSRLSDAKRAGCPPELLHKLTFMNVEADGSDIIDQRLRRCQTLNISRIRRKKDASNSEFKRSRLLKTCYMRLRGGKKKVSQSAMCKEDLYEHV
jgi:hypothetical protein